MKEAKIARGVIEELKIRAAKEQHEASAIIDSLKEEIHEKDEHMKNVQCALETAIQERDAAQKLKEEYASALEAARKDATSFKQQMEASFKQIEEKEELAQHLRADLGRTLQALDTADASLEKMELQSHKAITEKQHVIHKLQQELKDVRAEAQQNNATIKAMEKSLREQLANYESELVMTKSQLAAEVASRSELDKQEQSTLIPGFQESFTTPCKIDCIIEAEESILEKFSFFSHSLGRKQREVLKDLGLTSQSPCHGLVIPR
eukprot:jgi/Pico_ML_1/56039/g1637.t1